MTEEDSTVCEEELTAEILRLRDGIGCNILRLDAYLLRVVLSFVEELLRDEK